MSPTWSGPAASAWPAGPSPPAAGGSRRGPCSTWTCRRPPRPPPRRDLPAQLAARTVDRRYAALVWGHVEAAEGLIDAPLGRAEGDPTRVAVRTGGREARTRYL